MKDRPGVLPPEDRLKRLELYRPAPDFYDEMLAPEGTVRPHWKALIDSFEEMGEADWARRWQEGRRIIHENGITYNVYSDPRNAERPWPLDPLPLVMDSSEWAAIEQAISQRARLLNAILADLYGSQKLLDDRFLPPELVFPNPAFLRACCGFPVPGNIYLHIYAADLARSPDGHWWVIADRTQAPSGAGYALENRLVSGRVLRDVFRGVGIERVASFFQTYRETLRALAPGHKENPRIVVLTPGPYNETYFEHAFLARYLGYSLVEGADLAVRENRVFLRTLGGLLPVDLILRRQDDTYCDPLELRGDSVLGVPGLVQAVRSGGVAVANALGSGLVESAAPSGFLPALCRHMLHEDLKMPAVATWWCGQKAALSWVEDHLDSLVIKPAFPARGVEPVFAGRLSRAEKTALITRLRAAPGAYVAQEQVALSTAPVLEDNALRPRHVVLRVYAVAAGDSYAVMPGGLTRTTSSLGDLVASMQSGGGSKDTWVVATKPSPDLTLLRPPAGPLDISRATFDLPSRVADNLFWLGRYVERVEPIVRVVRAMLPRLVQDANLTTQAAVETGLRILAGQGYVRSDIPIGSAPFNGLEREVLALVYGGQTGNNLTASIRSVRRVGRLLRDRISSDAWRVLNQLHEQLSAPLPPEPIRVSSAQALLDQVISTISAFSGLVMESMTRGDGWRFLDIGRRLERALQMTGIIRYGLGFDCEADSGQLELLLEAGDSSITYRSRYLTSMQADLVLDLLLLDEANPRSVAYQLARLREHVDRLPASQSRFRRPAEGRLVLSLLTAVQLSEARDFLCTGGAHRTQLETLLQRLSKELWSLSEELTREYFSQAVPSRQFLLAESRL
ncbi:MAG: circularly permuted type 2 ATP-grasp protein [Acidobacteriia bacterium]|nr:circularly permuted type 2 ATP-grasp protein [Terriglobia bacterium]